MKKFKINSFKDFLIYMDSLPSLGNKIILFRGQSGDDSLLPGIARSNPRLDTTSIEREMLDEFKRRSYLLINKKLKSDWDLLTYAQHFGLKTRLLDWTSNPLVALWFACQNEHKLKFDSYVYIFEGDESMVVDLAKDITPFSNKKTQIFSPVLNNDRIVAQSGWFTAHCYSKKNKRFVGLESNSTLKIGITQLMIPASIKLDMLKKLAVFGANHRTIYPDINGLCEHMNWSYSEKIR